MLTAALYGHSSLRPVAARHLHAPVYNGTDKSVSKRIYARCVKKTSNQHTLNQKTPVFNRRLKHTYSSTKRNGQTVHRSTQPPTLYGTAKQVLAVSLSNTIINGDECG